MSGLKADTPAFQPSSRSWADDDDDEEDGTLSEQFAALSPKKPAAAAEGNESKGMLMCAGGRGLNSNLFYTFYLDTIKL